MNGSRVVLFGFMLCGCSVAQHRTTIPEIQLSSESTKLDGWLSTRGEWILFSSKEIDLDSYYPLDRRENEKCVSMVNDTGEPRSNFARWDGKRIVARGFTIRYDDLPYGETPIDQLMAKRYYKNERVPNQCLRDLVFVVSSIEFVP